MNLREHADLRRCDRCDRIQRCRRTDAAEVACLECIPLGRGVALVDHLVLEDNEELVTDGGQCRDDRYRIGDAREVLADLEVSASVVVLDDAWARPGRQGAFGVDYPTHSLEVSYELVDVSWDVLEPGGWLICDADERYCHRRLLARRLREGLDTAPSFRTDVSHPPIGNTTPGHDVEDLACDEDEHDLVHGRGKHTRVCRRCGYGLQTLVDDLGHDITRWSA